MLVIPSCFFLHPTAVWSGGQRRPPSLSEQDGLRRLGNRRRRVDFPCFLVSALHGRSRTHCVEPASEMREFLELHPLTRVRNDPRLAGNIGDRVHLGVEFAILQAMVEHQQNCGHLEHSTLLKVVELRAIMPMLQGVRVALVRHRTGFGRDLGGLTYGRNAALLLLAGLCRSLCPQRSQRPPVGTDSRMQAR